MATVFNIANWYWAVIGIDDFVWSSSRIAYVPKSDAEYQTWLGMGNTTSSIESRESLAAVMQNRVPTYLSTGLAVTSASDPTLNATYAMDSVTMAQIGSVARDVSSGMGFPQGVGTFDYPDITGVPHTFTETTFVALYKALRDYVSAVSRSISLLALGNYVSMPTPVATIP